MAGHAHVEHGGNKRTALLIAVLALVLALVETGAKSAQTESLGRNVEAANLWAFFQARTVRQTTLRTAVEQAELQKAALAEPAARAAVDAQQKAWRDTVARYESEPATGEGRKELSERAKAAEHIRDRSLTQYHQLEYAAALIQVAIVVVSASIITGTPILAVLGALLGVAGSLLGCLGWLRPEMFGH